MSKKKKLPEEVLHSEAYVKDFFDMVVPSAIKLNVDHYICGGSYRSVWAILEKQINEQGFDCHRARKEDIKQFLSRYFGHMCEDTTI